MLPLLAAAAGTAAMQYANSEQARRENRRIMDENRAILNGVPMPNLDVNDYYTKDVTQNLDPSQLDYGEYGYIGDYNPNQAQYDQEVGPRMVEQSDNAKFGRDAQVEALKKFQSNIKSGYDPEFQAKMDQAAQNSQAQAQSRMGSILQAAQRRGQSGSNATLAAQMHGSSDALAQGASQSQAAAVAAYQNQLQQQRDAAGMGRNLAADENSLAAQNASIINDFNQRSSRAHQQYLNQQADMQNQAALRNLNQQQTMANANVDTRNRQMADQYKAAQNERAYKNQLVGQRQGVQQNNFNNQMSKVTGQMNNNSSGIAMNNQAAADRNNAISGIGQGFSGYMSAQEAADTRADDRKFQAEQNAMDRDAKYGYGG